MGRRKLFLTLVLACPALLITTAILLSEKDELPSMKKKNSRMFHTAVTSSDSVYNTWQCRVMYYWFQKHNPNSNEMGGFTRILHSGRPDSLMQEIPTFVAQPLPASLHRGYLVLNRPWALLQWLNQAQIREDYILMCEPDHLILSPIPNLTQDRRHGAAFPFFYIDPTAHEPVLRKFFPRHMGPITNIDSIGNSPLILGKEALKRIVPTWMNVSIAMKKDSEADKAFGWVLEMYAYAVASAMHDVPNVLHKEFMIQPPWDTTIGNAYIIHYTYGCDYDLQGRLTYGKIGEWRFDKRMYGNRWPPRNLSMPPRGVPQSVVTLVKMVNEATANLPNWGAAAY
ncbi:hydroxyproline O-arabinosyltransferase 1-like [Salvia miltiorrhiza]|uniref:hydroxyproline O-arabinosyltransferase 1-like n=1 Tax=Salvia miltiorrhiza TaxID=226208 RepID=UPI0025ABCE27|nr:hydroxyproline O-arabinosyltransferase 1-like [Salvia miltiorrhiza]